MKFEKRRKTSYAQYCFFYHILAVYPEQTEPTCQRWLRDATAWGMKVFWKRFVRHLRCHSLRPEGKISNKSESTWAGSFMILVALSAVFFRYNCSRVCWLFPTILPHTRTIPFNRFRSCAHKDVFYGFSYAEIGQQL